MRDISPIQTFWVVLVSIILILRAPAGTTATVLYPNPPDPVKVLLTVIVIPLSLPLHTPQVSIWALDFNILSHPTGYNIIITIYAACNHIV